MRVAELAEDVRGHGARKTVVRARPARQGRIIILPVYRAVQAIAHGRSSHPESVVLMITPGS